MAGRENYPPPRFLGPGGRVLPGVRRVVQIPAPAVGQEWSATVPGGRVWRLILASGSLQTSAVVASRFMGFQVAVNGLNVCRFIGNYQGIASQVNFITYGPGAMSPAQPGQGFVDGWLTTPDVWMPQGTVFGSLTINKDPGDSWSAVNAWVMEYYGDESDIELGRELDAEAQLEALAAATQTTTGG